MKIFLIIPTLKQGGAERVMSVLANNLSRLGNEIHLVLLVHVEDFYNLDKNIVIHHLKFHHKNLFQKKISEINTFFKLRKLIAKEKPEVVLSFMDKYNVLTILVTRFLKTKVFVSDRSNPKKEISTTLKHLKKLTYKYATGVVAQTSLAKDIIYKNTKNTNIRVIPNPLKECSLYPKIRKENLIINVGRLTKEKGQKYLIEAFYFLNIQDWKLVILGDGDLEQELKNQINTLGLENRVIMPGAVKNVDEWLARASVFAFSSISEGFPNALVEAMALGLPCVSFDCDSGPRDVLIDNNNGFLIEPKNIEQLTDCLFKLCSDSKLRMRIGEEAKNISKKLDAKTITLEFLNFFNN
ncbi:glycosyltransferase family 4 protein [Polaribacter sp. IC063]|uniref:glycosyltransferase family 4 protein n=1 Tax=Polaribacter sp. IC063 TaxID=57031 RepID=UPI0011BDF966|nr:glycosyltransferase family 4 protein [Polaribacter sp. IC063]TXD51439.1 glycosyltransferase family 4 protein [Polaribacter sp. IC063]